MKSESEISARHIVVVGMMGSGKSTVGRLLARRLDLPFFDSDDEVVARTGRSVTEIFSEDGEEAFRQIEADVMVDLLAAAQRSVIAAAGGAILRQSTREKLASALVVWLQVPVDVLVTRTQRGTHRPALANDPQSVLTQMEKDRSALYGEVADIRIDASAPVEAVVNAIMEAVKTS